MATGQNPRLRRSFTVIGHSPDVVELRTGVWNTRSFTLSDDSRKGKVFDLVSGLDGTVSRKELAKRNGVSRTEVEAVVDHLDGLGALEEGPDSALDGYLDQVAALGRAAPSEQASRLLLLGDPELAAAVDGAAGRDHGLPVTAAGTDDPLVRRLAETDPGVVHDELALRTAAEEFEPWRGAFAAYLAATVDPLRLTLFNRLAALLDINWIHAAVDGPFLFVGPTVLPHRSACYECFETRVAMNLREQAGYVRYKEALARGAVRLGAPPTARPVAGLLASHTALEVTNFLHSGSAFTAEKVLGVYLPTMEIAYNEVLRLPGCTGCGSVAERDDSPLYFDPRAWLDA